MLMLPQKLICTVRFVQRKAKEADVDMNVTSHDGLTAVHLAIKSGHLDILRQLKAWGLDMNATFCEGLTSMHLAIQTGSDANA